MGESRTILYAAKISSCAWRVRAALKLKGIPFEEQEVEILKEKAHLTDHYRRINPAQKVPALVIDGATLIESMAIVQYLEDTRPEPRLTPSDPLLKARMREICEVIVSGVQPLQNVGIQSNFMDEQQYLKFAVNYCEKGLQTLEELLQRSSGQYCVGDKITIADLCLVIVSGIQPLQNIPHPNMEEQQFVKLATHYCEKGLQALEELLQRSSGQYCVGDELTMADLCFVPQVYNCVNVFKLKIDKYPTVERLYEKLKQEKAFLDSHPKNVQHKQ